ncbi:MAG: Na+/H+ antiporter subunit E [Burkholderiales bacterium]
MFRFVSLFIVLFLFWVVLSGFFTAFLLGAGALCALAVAWLARRMDVIDHEGHPVHLGMSALTYWPWLVKEIAKSAWAVSRIILDPRLPVSPTMVKFAPGQRTVVGLVTHANSITLTPGTISVEVEPGEFVVHGLTRDGAMGCIDSEMNARVSRFEGSAVKEGG